MLYTPVYHKSTLEEFLFFQSLSIVLNRQQKIIIPINILLVCMVAATQLNGEEWKTGLAIALLCSIPVVASIFLLIISAGVLFRINKLIENLTPSSYIGLSMKRYFNDLAGLQMNLIKGARVLNFTTAATISIMVCSLILAATPEANSQVYLSIGQLHVLSALTLASYSLWYIFRRVTPRHRQLVAVNEARVANHEYITTAAPLGPN